MFDSLPYYTSCHLNTLTHHHQKVHVAPNVSSGLPPCVIKPCRARQPDTCIYSAPFYRSRLGTVCEQFCHGLVREADPFPPLGECPLLLLELLCLCVSAPEYRRVESPTALPGQVLIWQRCQQWLLGKACMRDCVCASVCVCVCMRRCA